MRSGGKKQPPASRVGLPKIAFASLQDIRLPLPLYNEEVVWLQMSNSMADQYHDQAGGSMIGKPYPPQSLYNCAIEEMKEGTANVKHSSGAFSVWLTTALDRVNSMFRDEEVWFNRCIEGKGKYALRQPELVTTLDAIGDATISPKDRWLASGAQGWDASNDSLILWDSSTGRELQRFSGVLGAISPDWKLVALTQREQNQETTLILSDLASGEENHTLEAPGDIYGVSFSPKG